MEEILANVSTSTNEKEGKLSTKNEKCKVEKSDVNRRSDSTKNEKCNAEKDDADEQSDGTKSEKCEVKESDADKRNDEEREVIGLGSNEPRKENSEEAEQSKKEGEHNALDIHPWKGEEWGKERSKKRGKRVVKSGGIEEEKKSTEVEEWNAETKWPKQEEQKTKENERSDDARKMEEGKHGNKGMDRTGEWRNKTIFQWAKMVRDNMERGMDKSEERSDGPKERENQDTNPGRELHIGGSDHSQET